MDLNKLGNQFELIVGASCESTSTQERVILTKRAIGKYYKTEHELLKKENDLIDEQMSKDSKNIEETEKKIQEAKDINDQLTSAITTLSNAMVHLLARRNEVRDDVKKWESKINTTAQVMDDILRKEIAKREEGNEIYKAVVKKRNNIKALQIKQDILEKRVEVQQREIKQQKEINQMLFHNKIVEFVKAVKTHQRSIQLDGDIANLKLALNEMTTKFNQLSFNKLSTFKAKSVFTSNFRQTALNNPTNTLKPGDKRGKMNTVHVNTSKVERKEAKIISMQPNKAPLTTLKIQQPKTVLSSTDQEDNTRKDFKQRSEERKRKYLHLMSTSFDNFVTNYQDKKESNITNATTFEKDNLRKEVHKKIEKKPSKEECFTITPKTPSKKIKLIDNVKIAKPSLSTTVEGEFIAPKSYVERKQKKVSFVERKTIDEESFNDTNNTSLSGNESNQNKTLTSPNAQEVEVSKFFKKPEEHNSFWEPEITYDGSNEVNYSFLGSQFNTGKTSTENADQSAGQDNFFLTPNENNDASMMGFQFAIGNQPSDNPFSFL